MKSNSLLRLWPDESAQDLVEYVLWMVLIALFAIASMNALGEAKRELADRAVDPDKPALVIWRL